MAKAKFDLTSKTKEEIFRLGRATILGGSTVVLLSYSPQAGEFSARLADVFAGGIAGMCISLVSELASGFFVVKSAPRSTGIQADATHNKPRSIVVNGHAMSGFETTLTMERGGYVRLWPWQSRKRNQKRIIQGHRQDSLQGPPIIEELQFWSEGVQLAGSIVWRFLRYAERNRTQGKGLSERYWTGENRNKPGDWWNLAYYTPMMSLIDYASHKTGLQLIIIQDNQWRILSRSAESTWRLICWSVYPDKFKAAYSAKSLRRSAVV